MDKKRRAELTEIAGGNKSNNLEKRLGHLVKKPSTDKPKK